MNKAILAAAAFVLAAGPWLGWSASADSPTPVSPWTLPQARPVVEDPILAPVRRSPSSARCSCRNVVVEASNEVRKAEITTGDAKVRNRSLTYIGPGFDGKRVKVSQRARAETGDAIAGQILGVVSTDPCANVLVRASNVVEDSVVETGDALASNESLILYHPDARLGNTKIKVRQRARADTGDAIAGQILGIASAGSSECGGVTVEASNLVRRTEINTGEAVARNVSEMLACGSDECIERLLRYLRSLDSVQVCDADGCHDMSPEELIARLGLSLPDTGTDPSPRSPGPSPAGECGPVGEEVGALGELQQEGESEGPEGAEREEGSTEEGSTKEKSQPTPEAEPDPEASSPPCPSPDSDETASSEDKPRAAPSKATPDPSATPTPTPSPKA